MHFTNYRRLGFCILILLIVVFLFCATTSLESHYSLCVIKNAFGVQCPGCGMTRAIANILHGNIIRALQYNKSVIIVFPLLCYICLKQCFKNWLLIRDKTKVSVALSHRNFAWGRLKISFGFRITEIGIRQIWYFTVRSSTGDSISWSTVPNWK